MIDWSVNQELRKARRGHLSFGRARTVFNHSTVGVVVKFLMISFSTEEEEGHRTSKYLLFTLNV